MINRDQDQNQNSQFDDCAIDESFDASDRGKALAEMFDEDIDIEKMSNFLYNQIIEMSSNEVRLLLSIVRINLRQEIQLVRYYDLLDNLKKKPLSQPIVSVLDSIV